MYHDGVPPFGSDTTRSSPILDSGVLTVAPRKGAIEIRKLRLRIRLFRYPCDNNGEENGDGDGVALETPSELCQPRTTVVRRGDAVLLSASKGLGGAVVLLFRCVLECTTFCDRLVALSTSPQNVERKRTRDGKKVSTPSDKNKLDSKDVVSYAVRLIHDEDFMNFVNEVDTSLALDEGSKEIYESLGMPRVPKEDMSNLLFDETLS